MACQLVPFQPGRRFQPNRPRALGCRRDIPLPDAEISYSQFTVLIQIELLKAQIAECVETVVNTEQRPVSCVLWGMEGIGVTEIASGDTANVLLKVGCPQKQGQKENVAKE